MKLNKQHRKNILLGILKICISFLALYLVFRRVKFHEILLILRHINWYLLIFSFLFLNLSQLTSTARLKLLLNRIGIKISFGQNLALYYKGMFYNLFLPGGVGGDGVKAYILNKKYEKPLKLIVGSLIIDRLSGLVGLIFLASLALTICKINPALSWIWWPAFLSMMVIYPFFLLAVNIFFKNYKKVYVKMSVLGISVNIIQSVSVVFLFLAIGIKSALLEYLAVFYFATIALVFPFTVGGIGIRELVFITAPKFMPVDVHTGISFSLLFFAMNAVSSLTGIFVKTGTTV